MSDKMTEKKFICIMCPLGCEITAKINDSGNIKEMIGSKCPKGDKYVQTEFTKPMRVLTSTVSIEGAMFSRLPVRTSDLIPKDKISDLMKEIQKIKVKAPVKNGTVVLKNISGLEVDLISTRDL